jgi:hypothetical protein
MKNPQRVVDSNFDRFQARNNLISKNQSQLNKLLPQLELRAKKAPEDSQVKAKLELKRSELVKLKAKLEKAVLKVSKLYVVEKPEQLKRLTAALKSITAIMQSKPPLGVSKCLKASANELTSLREGVFIGAAVDKKALSIIACHKAVKQVDELISSTQKAIANVGQEDEVRAAESEEKELQDFGKVLKQTQKEAQNISALQSKPFVLTRVPVVPLTKGSLNTSALQRAGFQVDKVSDYTVFHNQLVLGINKSFLELRKGAIERQIDPKKIMAKATEVKKMIEKQTGQKYFFVLDKPYGAVGGSWFWLMTERDLKAFAKVFPGGFVKIDRFGFAF